MKLIYTTILASVLSVSAQFTQAQDNDSTLAASNALKAAESLIKASFYQDWKSYADLSNPSAIKFYGGPQQFKEHVVTMYFRNEPKLEEKPETLRITELRNDVDQWQSVIEKVRNTFIDGKKAIITSYIVGQSLDGGKTWKFIDVSHNSLENLAFIFPTIFTDLTIPLGKTVIPSEIVEAQPVVEEAPKPAPKKRVATKPRK
ncbi:hypothetical protein [Paraflavitalea sp. CAU 1676]|uniref:hypothetical protein n=1 Tax=Paraflavitalea sp. CAU 1676 TaxID=3032598 RepID=UPI0023DAD918|nr:hypothetical protein [Paraflavitalea sp. CAU 1676]MDF2192491.1 hypothetical protein [Paraflavitalea sp. CAU 1676]